MPLDPDVFLSILAMDSYNRGYGAGIGGLSQEAGTRIGTAVVVQNAEDAQGVAEAAGFYATAYNYNGETVISYRGTDTSGPVALINDIVYGWTFGGGFSGADQVALGIKFYQAVAASIGAGTDWRNAAG